MSLFSLFFAGALVEHHVYDDAQDQGGSDGGDLHGAQLQLQAADAGDQDGRHNEQVAVVIQIHMLHHLKARYSDEAVQGDANATGDAGGNRVNESHEGIEEGQDDAVDRGDRDGAAAVDGGRAYHVYRTSGQIRDV